MANQRTNLPARLQQILSGGRAAVPSLKLESDPPPDVKSFIDRVIKSPLHDIAIPLSGFRWEYNKGNFHHWRPLFIHFDTYFKTYLSGRKDLLLTDAVFEDESFPKHSVLQILRVMQIILDNCHNKSSFGGMEHFKHLLSSTDPDILIGSLETLSALVRINPSKLHGSVKPIGCNSLNNYLLSLAQGWGSKEEGLGLFSCVVANERNQHDGLSLFPMEVEDACNNNQYRLGSTLHFEFHCAADGGDGLSGKGQSSHMRVIHIPNLHLRKEDDLTLLKQCIDEYTVPVEHRFSLLTRIRYAHAFHSPRTCRMYSKICILAFIVLVQSNDAHDELVSFFAHEPEYTNELIRLVRSENSVPGTIKALAMFALGAQLAAYTSSHERARILSGSSIISAGGNRMVLLTVLQKAILSLDNPGDPTAILFVEALLQFFLLHVLSSSSSGSAIRGSGMVSPLLPLLRDTDSSHVHLVHSAVKTLQKLMEYSNPAVTLFKDLGGIELLVQRLQTEVSRVIGIDVNGNSTITYGDLSKPDDDALYSQKRLIKILLKALGSASYSPANTPRSQNSNDNKLPGSLSLIFSNAEKFGGDIYFSAVTVMSEMIHKDPTCFGVLLELGLPDAFLSSIEFGILPSSKALICVPGALGAICLNAKGLEAVKKTDALKFLIDVFTTKKYLVAMNEGVVLLANAVEELLRHVSSLRSTGVEIIIEIIRKLALLGENKCHASTSKVDEDGAMEVDVDDKESRGRNLVGALDLATDSISNDHFVQLCIFHAMVLVHRTMENSETCRLFVEKEGIDAMMKLLLQPCIAESAEGTPIALHSTVVFKGFAQHHSSNLAHAFCAALRDHLHKALSGLKLVSGSSLLHPNSTPDRGVFSPLFVIEFLLFLAACKDHRWMTVLLTEFGNGNKDVLEDIGRLHREVLWQIALLEDVKIEAESDVSSSGDASSSESSINDGEEQRFSSLRQYIDPLLRRRASGWSVESQFLDLISMYRDIGRAATNLRRPVDDLSANLQIVAGPHSQSSGSSDADSIRAKNSDKQRSYFSQCRELLRSLSYHTSHLFLELGKAMLLSSRRGSDPVNVSPSAKSVVSTFASVALEHLNFSGHVGISSEKEIAVSTKCRYLGKVIDFIDVILMDKPDSCNPILVNCFFVRGVVEGVLTTFEATSQLLFAVNRPATCPMETDDEFLKHDAKEETDNSWIYGPLASYGGLMDHLVTSSFIISSFTKQLLEQPIVNGDIPFPGEAEALVKVLQSKVLKAMLPIWSNPRFTECKYQFIAATISVIRHVYSGVEVTSIGVNSGIRSVGPPPDESTISLIVEMGFTRSRAEEALRQVGTNSVELATDWLFSHPDEPQEDDELARALKLSLGSGDILPSETTTDGGPVYQEMELTQLPPVDELLSTCTRLLQANESFVFPVRDLLITIATKKEGECRSKVVQTLINQLSLCSSQLATGNSVALSALMHVLALVLHGDATAREIASSTGLVGIVFDILSQWEPASCAYDKAPIPKWATASFLAIDQMLQINPTLSPELIASENHQTPILDNGSNVDDVKFSLGVNKCSMQTQDKKRFIEIACKCIKAQLPSDTMHVVMQLCATLTKEHSAAVSFLDAGGLQALLSLPTSSLFPGFDTLTAMVVRHILEDPQTLQQAMESEIKHSLLAAASRHTNGRVSTRSFVQSLSSVISRDPVVFMRAAQSSCQIEIAGERQYIVLLKDREKEKVKEKASDKEKPPVVDGKLGAGDSGSVLPDGAPNKLQDSNSKSVKSHRKPPQSFSTVIELLLDVIMMFIPPANLDPVPEETANTTPPTDMDIDTASSKGKGKAVATLSEASRTANREASASLAKSVFILKLLTEVLVTYTSSIHVILRRDAEISSIRGPQKGSSANCGGNGIFHHIIHKFLSHTGIIKKDKKSDGDWRQKLATRTNQFLVASCVRSAEGRKRIFSEVNHIFMEFVDSSGGCEAPDSRLHTFVDLLNDILTGRSSTGSYISAEASVTFIDAGLVRSLTRTLQVLDLDHADSYKVVTGVIKALELVTKEHAHSTDHGSKGDPSAKSANEQNVRMRIDANGNRFLPLETASQPDNREIVADHMDSFNAAQTSVFSDSVTDDMDHDRDIEGGFTLEEDDFMHEPSEAGRSLEDGVSTVEISFEIPRNVEDNIGEEDDDEDMSGDDAEGDGEEEDDDDEENNDLEEDDVHHMSHPDTDQEEHEVDEEEFDEDVEEEDEDDDEDGGVILRLGEGINGINVFDQIELLGPGGSNFPNDTLRVMPLEVFGSRRQGRSASIYNLLGRPNDNGFSADHPLLTEPSSIRQLVQQRQSENAVDVAFSDRNSDNNSSRLDNVFRSLRGGRQHRFNMWVDDARQRGGSASSAIPQGIEELLASHLRRPTPTQTSENNASAALPQETNENNQLNQFDEVRAASTEDSPAENIPNDSVHQPTSAAEGNRDTYVGPTDDGLLEERETVIGTDQAIDMQYDRNYATVRDMEAVSLESGGSSATLGESLRSLDVEIGSADGHDDGERHGDQASRGRRFAGGTGHQGNRDISLEIVTEVAIHDTQEARPDQLLEDQQVIRNVDTNSIDPTFLEALPEELRAEVLSAQQNQGVPSSNEQPHPSGDIDPEFLAALPPDIRAEVLAQQQAQRLHQSQELEGQPVEMDAVSIIATFPSELREEVLLTSSEAVLANLSPALVAEANLLRERFAHRYHGGGTLFGVYPRSRRGEPSRRGDVITSGLERGGTSRKSLGNKIIEAEGSPLLDTEALRAMIRLLRVVQPLYKGQLQKLLLNLCVHHETRSSLVQLLMDMLMLDVHGNLKSSNGIGESPYRLYGCPSHISYSRPQFSDGVPPLVSRRILETLKYLAQYHPNVAKLLLHFKLTTPPLDNVDNVRGKAVMILEDEHSGHKNEHGAIVLLLSLLNQPLYLRSIAHLEQLLSLLDVVVGSAENDLDVLDKISQPPEQNSGSVGAVQDAPTNMDVAGPSIGDGEKPSLPVSVPADISNVGGTCAILTDLPQSDLRQLCSLLAREGLSDGAYGLVADVLKKLVTIVPDHCNLFIRELANAIQNLSFSAVKELQKYEETEKAMLTSSSTDGTAILRVLQALSSLTLTLHEKKKETDLLQEKDRKDVVSVVGCIKATLEPLWLELSNCISRIECSSESMSDFASKPTSTMFTSTSAVPPLPMGTQNILPYIESFFVTCEKLHSGQSAAIIQEIGTASVSDVEDAINSGGAHKASGSAIKGDERNHAFVKFSEKHRKLLNAFVRQNPGLLEKSFSLLLKVPRFIDFDNKRSHFRSKIKHQHDHHHSSLRISVRRAYILEDSYHQLRMRSPQELKGRLTVHFQGEEGIDAGGLTREWYQVLSRVIFDKGALLFTTVGNESTFQPNPNSVFQTEHLSYFKFVGRVVGKALFDGQLLDVHFTRSFYKHILGVKVTYHDIEAIDPDYYKNLKWMLENDISDVLGLTFSIDADEEKLILYERSEVTDYELKPGGRNIRVTEENKHEYVDLVAEHRLTTAIRPQINAFMEGFGDLIQKELISIFNDKELELLISGLPDIDLDDLRANTEYSGYTNASPVIQWFWDVVQGFSKEDKARLLQFVTGTSKVPLEGFSALQGISGSQRFQIHKAYGSPDHLPSAHTCFNQLDLPEYPSKEQLQGRLLLAIHEANEGFGFG